MRGSTFPRGYLSWIFLAPDSGDVGEASDRGLKLKVLPVGEETVGVFFCVGGTESATVATTAAAAAG